MIELAEQPLLRTAPAPLLRLSGSVRAAGLKVVLTGEGADELFGGYDIFREDKIRRFWARDPESRLRPRLFGRVNRWLATDPSQLRRDPRQLLPARAHGRRRPALQPPAPVREHLTRCSGCFSPSFVAPPSEQAGPLERLTGLLPARLPGLQRALASPVPRGRDAAPAVPAARARRSDADGELDRGAVSLPRLSASPSSRRRLPDRLRLRGLEEKYVLRRAAARELPAAIHALPKTAVSRADPRRLRRCRRAGVRRTSCSGRSASTRRACSIPAAVARLRAKLGSSNGQGRQRDGRDGPRRVALPDARPRPVRREPAARASPRADAGRRRRITSRRSGTLAVPGA